MTDRRSDPVRDLLSGSRVPPLPADFADRVVAEARRADRVPSLTPSRSRRPRARRWTRRGAWTAALAINLVVASAVAAALGSGAVKAPTLIAAARHVVERLTHRASSDRPRHDHARHLANASPARPASPPPLEPESPAERPLLAPQRLPVPLMQPRQGGHYSLPRPARMQPAPQRFRPARRPPPEADAARRPVASEKHFKPRRFAPGQWWRFDAAGVRGPRFNRLRAGPRRINSGPRFDGGGRRGGGFRRAWRGPRGGPRRRF